MKNYHDNLMEGTKIKLIIGAIIAIIMLLWSAVANAQIQKIEKPETKTVGTAKSAGTIYAKLTYSYQDGDTLYGITYRNGKYIQLDDYRTIVFNNEGNTVEELYKLLIGIVSDNAKEKGYKESIKLGETDITIAKERIMGVNYVRIWEGSNHFMLSEKQLNALFGKN